MYVNLQLIGRLVRDPKFAYTNSGKAVCNFTVAADNGWGKNKSTVFIKCTAWNGTAEFAGKYLHKGYLIFVEGGMSITKNKSKKGTIYKEPDMNVKMLKPLSDPKATKEEYEPRKNDIGDGGKKESDNTKNKKETEFDDNIDVDDFDIPF